MPHIVCGREPLRLHSVPMPLDAWEDGARDHDARMAATRTWLLRACGDYNLALGRRVTRYLDAVAAHIDRHRDALAAGLARFHGLYQPDDWFFSALRPLPRAWWQQGDAWSRADLAFWDGQAIVSTAADTFAGGDLPPEFAEFWRGAVLPVTPFRQDIPGAAAFRS